MNEDWLNEVKARRLDGPLLTALDILEPFGPLAANLLWLIQPAAGVFGSRRFLGELASVLDDPEEVIRLRKALEKSSNSP